MNVAIIGAGLSGLSLAWHLLQNKECSVSIFDAGGVGSGASGVASGLMHPYPGEQSRRSWKAEEGLLATKKLLDVSQNCMEKPVFHSEGLIRIAMDEEQKKILKERCEAHSDLIPIDENTFFIASGATIFAELYLEGLWKACKGAAFYKERIDNLQELERFDQIIVAAGEGIGNFEECRHLPVHFIRGQTLKCKIKKGALEKSLIGKGYVAKDSSGDYCHLGATYERANRSDVPDIAFAKEEILPKIALFFPHVQSADIVECKAGVRVMNQHSYIPIAGRAKKNVWVLGAMGSRGLLYHAFLGELLAKAVLTDNEECLPLEIKRYCASEDKSFK